MHVWSYTEVSSCTWIQHTGTIAEVINLILPAPSQYRVGDWLLSVNNHTPKSATHANEVIKSLPRGPVHVVAMAPPCNVTGLSEGVCPAPPTEPAPPPSSGHESLPEVPPAPPPQGSEAPAPHPTGEQPWRTGDEPVSAEEDKVIEVEVSRKGCLASWNSEMIT